MAWTEDPEDTKSDDWDEEFARELIGHVLLVGLTYLSPDGEPTRQEQVHGVVVAADRASGIGLELQGVRAGERFALPPDTASISRGDLGNYHLSQTGEIVRDPTSSPHGRCARRPTPRPAASPRRR